MKNLTFTEFTNLRRLLSERSEEVRTLQSRLAAAERSCVHRWSPVTQTVKQQTEYWPKSLYHKDARFDTVVLDVPAWERTCEACGKVESTTDTQDVVTKVPKF